MDLCMIGSSMMNTDGKKVVRNIGSSAKSLLKVKTLNGSCSFNSLSMSYNK